MLVDARAFIQSSNAPAALDVYRRMDSLLALTESLDPRWNAPTLARGWLTLNEARVTSRFDAGLRKGVGFAEHVLAARSSSAPALALRGTLRFELWNNGVTASADSIAAAERDLRGAVLQDPSLARAWYALSELLFSTGRFDEAGQAARRALGADAWLSDAPVVITDLFITNLLREQFDEARFWCAQGVRRYAEDPNFRDCELRILGWSGKGPAQVARAWHLLATADARDTADPSPFARLDRRMMVAAVLTRSGSVDSARAVITRAKVGVSDSLVLKNASEEAYVRVLLGEHDEALRLLSAYLHANPQARAIVAESPWYRPLRGDPRFVALVGRDQRSLPRP
jgi:tetratricopeptide (TPR) repeat protein